MSTIVYLVNRHGTATPYFTFKDMDIHEVYLILQEFVLDSYNGSDHYILSLKPHYRGTLSALHKLIPLGSLTISYSFYRYSGINNTYLIKELTSKDNMHSYYVNKDHLVKYLQDNTVINKFNERMAHYLFVLKVKVNNLMKLHGVRPSGLLSEDVLRGLTDTKTRVVFIDECTDRQRLYESYRYLTGTEIAKDIGATKSGSVPAYIQVHQHQNYKKKNRI